MHREREREKCTVIQHVVSQKAARVMLISPGAEMGSVCLWPGSGAPLVTCWAKGRKMSATQNGKISPGSDFSPSDGGNSKSDIHAMICF